MGNLALHSQPGLMKGKYVVIKSTSSSLRGGTRLETPLEWEGNQAKEVLPSDKENERQIFSGGVTKQRSKKKGKQNFAGEMRAPTSSFLPEGRKSPPKDTKVRQLRQQSGGKSYKYRKVEMVSKEGSNLTESKLMQKQGRTVPKRS